MSGPDGTSYTRINLRDVDDSAVRFGLPDVHPGDGEVISGWWAE